MQHLLFVVKGLRTDTTTPAGRPEHADGPSADTLLSTKGSTVGVQAGFLTLGSPY
jgi:hypothetical protein